MDVCRGSAVSSRRADPKQCGRSPRTPNARRHSSRLAFSSAVAGACAAGSAAFAAPGPSPLGRRRRRGAHQGSRRRRGASPRTAKAPGRTRRASDARTSPRALWAAPAAAAAAARPALGAPARVWAAPAGGGARPSCRSGRRRAGRARPLARHVHHAVRVRLDHGAHLGGRKRVAPRVRVGERSRRRRDRRRGARVARRRRRRGGVVAEPPPQARSDVAFFARSVFGRRVFGSLWKPLPLGRFRVAARSS